MANPARVTPPPEPAIHRCSICGTSEGEILAFGEPEERDERSYECRACWGPDELAEGAVPEAKRFREDLQGRYSLEDTSDAISTEELRARLGL